MSQLYGFFRRLQRSSEASCIEGVLMFAELVMRASPVALECVCQ